MDTNQHARVLNAYLSRLSNTAIEDIAKTQRAAWHASMNLGLTAQIKAQEAAALAVQTAIGQMIDHDKNNIQRVIETAL